MLIGTCPSALAKDEQQEIYATLHSDLVAVRGIRDGYEKTLAAVLNFSRPQFKDAFSINRPCRAQQLCVYIVDAEVLMRSQSLLRGALAKQVSTRLIRNAVSQPPNILVFDQQLLTEIMLHSLNDLLALGQAAKSANDLASRGASASEILTELHKWSQVANYKRLANLRQYAQVADWNAKSTRTVMEALRREDLHAMMAPALAPIVLHELGHLHSRTSGHLLEPLQNLLNDILSYPARQKLLKEEEAADEYAARELRVIFAGFGKEFAKPTPGDLAAAESGFQVQALLASLKYLRDVSLVDAFASFRGLQPEDLFVNFVHRNCHTEPATKDMAFDNPHKIRDAYFEYFPLISAAEFQQVRTGLLKRIRNGTHPHHLTRADKILSATAGPALGAENARAMADRLLGPARYFLDAVLKNDPMLLHQDLSGTVGLGLADLKKGFEDSFKFAAAANCPKDSCWIGTLKSGKPGFIEIISAANSVRRVRFTFPMFGGAGIATINDENAESYVENLTLMLGFMAIVSGEPLPTDEKGLAANEGVRTAISMRHMLLQCGAGSLNFEMGRKRLRLRTMNEMGWVSIEVLPG